ncbi:MAG: carboxymuconolactone decarboxylase family protein [Myxococcales bacterium]|nr:carboxymuconolactone decarboxylase family protein [Myxococcales bacterium]
MAAYFDDKDLASFPKMGDHAREHWQRFMAYYGKAFDEGLLSKREKLLIGFAVAHSEKCPYCIDSYTQQLLEAGLTMEHMGEALHCVASLKAGITLAHGLVSKNISDKLGM